MITHFPACVPGYREFYLQWALFLINLTSQPPEQCPAQRENSVSVDKWMNQSCSLCNWLYYLHLFRCFNFLVWTSYNYIFCLHFICCKRHISLKLTAHSYFVGKLFGGIKRAVMYVVIYSSRQWSREQAKINSSLLSQRSINIWKCLSLSMTWNLSLILCIQPPKVHVAFTERACFRAIFYSTWPQNSSCNLSSSI